MSLRSDGFKDFVLDQLADLRGITARAMFGGYGLYHRATFLASSIKTAFTSTCPRPRFLGTRTMA